MSSADGDAISANAPNGGGGEDVMPGWDVELFHQDFRTCLRIDNMLYESDSDHQRLRLFENNTFGRVLTLDGVVQTCESDEAIYHEMLAHVPLFAHGEAEQVLVVGGGDGGMVREVLRHASVKKVVLVEIDASVIEFSKEHMPSLSRGAFDDPRLEVVITDGAEWVKQAELAGTFDVAIIDSTDPVGPGAVLFTREFYTAVAALLDPSRGVVVTQNGMVFLDPDELSGTLASFRDLFADWGCYTATVPTYTGGPMAFGWGSHAPPSSRPSAKDLEARFAAANLDTFYYAPDVHLAAFVLPVYVKKIVAAVNSGE